MMNNTLVSIIGGVVVLVLIVVAIVIRMKNNPSLYDKEQAQEFLKGLADTFYNKMVTIILDIDFKSFNSLEEVETSIISQIYDEMWIYVENASKNAAKDDIITVMVLKAINKETVDIFIDKLITEKEISKIIENRWNDNAEVAIEKTSENVIESEKELIEEFSDSEQYNETYEEELPEAVVEEPTEEELSLLNPPTEEEKEYDPESDSSVEVVDEEDIYFYDSKGRRRNKKNGRYA